MSKAPATAGVLLANVESRVRGDKTNVFKVGNVLITLTFVTEGVIDRGHLILTAENQGLRGVAEAECQKYYQERSRRDVQNMKGFQNGGIDAL